MTARKILPALAGLLVCASPAAAGVERPPQFIVMAFDNCTELERWQELTDFAAEIAPWLASHADVNALDLVGAGELDWVDLEFAAADTLKRVLRPEQGPDAAAPTLDRITAFTETKTVWHTKSLK